MARTFEEYLTMSEKAIEKAQEALRDGNQGMYSIHLTASSVFSALALACATRESGKVQLTARAVENVKSTGYL